MMNKRDAQICVELKFSKELTVKIGQNRAEVLQH